MFFEADLDFAEFGGSYAIAIQRGDPSTILRASKHLVLGHLKLWFHTAVIGNAWWLARRLAGGAWGLLCTPVWALSWLYTWASESWDVAMYSAARYCCSVFPELEYLCQTL